MGVRCVTIAWVVLEGATRSLPSFLYICNTPAAPDSGDSVVPQEEHWTQAVPVHVSSGGGGGSYPRYQADHQAEGAGMLDRDLARAQ